jgi:hypothetical protein
MARAIVTIDAGGYCIYEPNDPDLTLAYSSCEAPNTSSDTAALALDAHSAPKPEDVDEIGSEYSRRDACQLAPIQRPSQIHLLTSCMVDGLYISNMSSHPGLLWTVIAFVLAGNDASIVIQAYWMGHWASKYEKSPPSEVSAP